MEVDVEARMQRSEIRGNRPRTPPTDASRSTLRSRNIKHQWPIPPGSCLERSRKARLAPSGLRRYGMGRPMIGQRGVGLIEVLISLVVIAIGLLGLAALQGKAQKAELESYQRSQALILLQDMASRLRANRGERTNYVTSGCASPCSTVPTTPTAARDLCEWASALTGANERLDGQSVGAMLSGCGCITGAGNEFTVSVAWQGLASVLTPTTNDTCGSGIPTRRVMSVPVRFFDPG